MFRPGFDGGESRVAFTFDGAAMTARQGDTVAAALLANGVSVFRESAISGVARGPYCMMGVCFECLVAIDGVGNRQACLATVEDGMAVETQKGRRGFQPDAEA
jgi:predicted molibdopterin-dependent oxidoreductase YjgC